MYTGKGAFRLWVWIEQVQLLDAINDALSFVSSCHSIYVSLLVCVTIRQQTFYSKQKSSTASMEPVVPKLWLIVYSIDIGSACNMWHTAYNFDETSYYIVNTRHNVKNDF